jgi:parvulin-like peptidyl-prolyl isomerase
MENIETQEKQPSPEKEKINYVQLKFKKPTPLAISIVVAVLILLTAVIFAKGLFVAAMVNGNPIIKELEKKEGKQILENIINEKIIKDELNKQKIEVSKEEIDEEIKKIEEQVVGQGEELETTLAQQGLTIEKFREQITLEKKLEKLLASKIIVTELEIDSYIKESKVTPPKDVKIDDFKNQIGEQLKQDKFKQEAQKWVSNLTSNAKIKYYVNY